MSNAPCGHPLAWTGLYRKDYDLATPESTAHPAKASWDLAFKILDHLQELGLLKEGATVLDPMAGTGRFLLAACAKGYKAIAVELEPKFIKMLEDNKTYASKKLCLPGFELPLTIIQGDARRLSQLLQERGLIAVSSPPYQTGTGQSKSLTPLETGTGTVRGHGFTSQGLTYADDMGETPGQIGSLPDRPFTAITSPPYEDSDVDGARKMSPSYFDRIGGIRHTKTVDAKAEGQIGQERGQTYLEAMAQVYAEIAKVADVLVVVVKNPTRNGKLRRLDLDTIALLEATGWKLYCQHRAILFEEQEMGHLFEGQVKKPRGRLSFFKRLSYRKGSPVAMWEDVLVAVKGEGQGMCAVTSPPYGNPRDTSEEYDDLYDLRCPPGVKWGRESFRGRYGDSSGQIGKLRDK